MAFARKLSMVSMFQVTATRNELLMLPSVARTLPVLLVLAGHEYVRCVIRQRRPEDAIVLDLVWRGILMMTPQRHAFDMTPWSLRPPYFEMFRRWRWRRSRRLPNTPAAGGGRAGDVYGHSKRVSQRSRGIINNRPRSQRVVRPM
ncbi:hypothetical protein EVAR_40281_1 [Eumeta japonica]|uniref:Uncharacterized protein n=1 Tax=Eumeta variegata TaxID=151549 RepID=A0A4C1WVN2_EUMVA|nr:hypothetical protein EVAR_40281_1 [Eumeta japonica]